MITRAFIQVDGLPGSGKTSVLEQVLRSNRSFVLSVLRTEQAAGVQKPRESGAENDAELQRLIHAGATFASRLRCPSNSPIDEQVWDSELLMDYSQGILIEGPLAEDFPADLRIFVCAAPTDGGTLVGQQPKRPTNVRTLRELLDSGAGGFERLPSPVPPLAAGFAAAGFADVLIVNVRTVAERVAAAVLAREFEALPRAFGRSRVRKARVVDLTDARDPELKKVVAAVKRALQSAT